MDALLYKIGDEACEAHVDGDGEDEYHEDMVEKGYFVLVLGGCEAGKSLFDLGFEWRVSLRLMWESSGGRMKDFKIQKKSTNLPKNNRHSQKAIIVLIIITRHAGHILLPELVDMAHVDLAKCRHGRAFKH